MVPKSSQLINASPDTYPSKRGNTGLAGETRLVPIRILYTLNTSPQYLLARQRRRVQVVPISEDGDELGSFRPKPLGPAGVKQRYAKVSLKACLSAVCNASPELVADRSRDYSVYVVDPLECAHKDGNATIRDPESSAADSEPSNIPSMTSCPWGDGVSIGMGLMSWCLAEDNIAGADDDEGYVIGKLVKDRGSESLEIVMSLRETTTQTQHQHALSLSSWGSQGSLTIPLPGRSSPSASHLASPFPTSPSPYQPHSFPTLSQTSSVNTALEDECLSELEEGPVLHSLTSSAPNLAVDPSLPSNQPLNVSAAALKRIGRPPGARTHPEKRARRLAIQTHKEKLERLEHIAKMQRGEEYDKTLVKACDHDGPGVTDEEIAQQRKLLEDLEARPLIVDQLPKVCLTSDPLPKRATSASKTAGVKRKRKSAMPNNAIASGSGIKQDQVHSALGETPTDQQLGAQLLLSLLTSVLGKVDEPSATDSIAAIDSFQVNDKGKGKQTAPVDNALAGALRQLLPLLPNNTSQINTSSTTPSLTQVPPMYPTTSPDHNMNSVDVRSYIHSHTAPCAPSGAFPRPLNVPNVQRPFQTTEEAFYSEPPRAPPRSLDEVWASQELVTPDGRNRIPKVREDAHPVPGGGWARGRKLVPRDALPQRIHQSEPSSGASTEPSGDGIAKVSTTVATPDKENLPPTKTKRGLKRGLTSVSDAKENANSFEAFSSGTSTKKRKQGTASGGGSDVTSSGRPMMGSAESNKATASSNMVFAASSPARRLDSMSNVRSMPVIAMSEPESLSLRLARIPSMAPSTPLDCAIGTPRTPPKHDRLLEDEAHGSLFTPRAPGPASRGPGDSHPSTDNLLFSPSPVPAHPRGSHVVETSQGASVATRDAESVPRVRHVSTGWDLPPSSPPPPTSPILPGNDVDVEESDQMDFEFAIQLQSEFDVEMENAGTDGRFEDRGIAINGDAGSTSKVGAQESVADNSTRPDQRSHRGTPFSTSDFELSSEGAFDFGELAPVEDEFAGTAGIELDIEELWSSLGPVIAHAQTDQGITSDLEALPQGTADMSFFGMVNNQIHAEAEAQSGLDPVKLAEDLKALFGGCVV